MSDGGPRTPEHGKPPADHPSQLLRFDDEASRRGLGFFGQIRRHPGVVVFVLALATAWWAWHGLHRPPPTTPEAVEPAPPAQPAPTVTETPKYRPGVLPLSDSVFSRPVGSSVTLTTRVMGEDSLPLADTLVVFHVVQGTGTLQPDTARTDEEGLARTSLTLPSTPGRVVVSADLVGSHLPWARFSVTARSGTPTRARIFAGDRQKADPGALLARRLVLRVTDQAGTPVPGVDVRFQVVGGGGVVAPSHAPTDSSGLASTLWRLGNAPGDQFVAAMVPDIGDALITFTATAVEPAAAAAATPRSGTPQPTVSQPAARSEPTPATVTGRTFAVGGNFVCALSSGHLSCRGGNDREQRVRQSSESFAAVAAGVSHACALTGTGQAWCWGADESGQLGDGSRTDRATPDSVVTDSRFSMLAAGVSHTCGLAADGKVLCWGKNMDGQLGDGSTRDRSTPSPISGSHRFVGIVAGWNHTCGLSTSGEVFCWGLNDRGQLGDGTLVDRLVPLNGPGTFESIVAGSAHTCGIRGGQVLCWGDNRFGQLGDGTNQGHTNPALVQGLPEAAMRLAAGAVSTCALLASGHVYCWGQNVHGELGDGTRDNRTTPVPVAGDLTFRSIYAGGALTCGFTRDGVQYCWGLNQSGQLGDGTRESRPVPTRVGG